MKKQLYLIIKLCFIILAACSKEGKITDYIEGDWELVSFAGKHPGADISESYSFSKTDDKSGNGTYYYTGPNSSAVITFTYTLSKNIISMNMHGRENLKVIKFEESILELQNSYKEIYVLKAK